MSTWKSCAFRLVVILAVAGLGRALQEPSEPQVQVPSAEDVQAALAALEGAGLSPEDREQAQQALEEAAQALAEATQSAARADELEEATADAPARAEALRAELAQAPGEVAVSVTADSGAAAIAEALARAQAELAAAEDEIDALKAESDGRDARRAALIEESARATAERDRLQGELAATEAVEGDALAYARRARLAAQFQAAVEALRASEAELAWLAARRELAPLERDLAIRKRAQAERRVELLGEVDRERSRREAEAARAAAGRVHQSPVELPARVVEIAEENERLAEERLGPRGLGAEIEHWTKERRALEERARELAKSHERLRLLVEIGESDQMLAAELRRQYEDLTDPADLERRAHALQREHATAEFRRFEYEEQRATWGDVELKLQELMDELEGSVPEEQRDELRATLRELLVARRDLVEGLVTDSATLSELLLGTWQETRKLADEAADYESFIEEHILWVRSVYSGWIAPGAVTAALRWLLDPGAWREGLGLVGRDVVERPLRPVGLVLLVVLLAGLRHRCRTRLYRHAEKVASWRTDSFRHTLSALADSAFRAALWPVLLGGSGWLLARPDLQVAPLRALGHGLGETAWMLFPLTFLRNVVVRDGLGTAHFRWPESAVAVLRRHLNWFLPLVAVPSVLAHAFAVSDARFNDSAGRLAFCIGMGALAFLCLRTLAPGGAALQDYLARNSGGWIARLQRVWYALAVGMPLAGIFVALAGWYYTAFQLETRLEQTLGWILLLVLVNAVLQRWLLVVRRRLSLEQARARARARAEAGEDAPLDEDTVDIPSLDSQTRQLFRLGIGAAAVVGLWLIWTDVLPALRVLERVQLWPRVQVVAAAGPEEAPAEAQAKAQAGTAAAAGTGATGTGAGGETRAEPSAGPTPPGPGGLAAGSSAATSPETGEAGRLLPVSKLTLADLGKAILILVAMGIAARNLPGLIEFALLQRLPLERGARFALTTIVRYLIVIIGATWAFSAVGIGWAKVQWLAAALTFGLAFGLQEIFANFVSGLIILIERPIRIGDLVTVSETYGKVTRIRMRATTITDEDQRELLVPNRAFITGELINWTLSDPVTRLVILVGIEYGSDTQRARDLLLRVAHEAPGVLDEPPARAIFRSFGESTLDFELRVHIQNREEWAQITSDLHFRIDEAFRQAGIVIAFPQRDLHVRSLPEGLLPAGSPASSPTGDSG